MFDDFRSTTDEPALIAHRGFAGVYPGNTIAAVDGAVRDGADAIEIDVQQCRDGEVVVFHDRRLDATTDAEGVVTETPCETVLRADVEGSGEPIPTFEGVMDRLPSDVGVNVELKRARSDDRVGTTAGDNRWSPLAERTVEIASRYDNAVLVSSFFPDALAAARAVDPSLALACLCADAVGRAFLLAARYDCVAIHPSVRLTDRALVDRARSRELAIAPYTVTKRAQAERLRELGVDGVIAEYPDVLE